VTTHQVDDVQNVLTDLMFINHGRIILSCSMEDFESRYLEVTVRPEQVTAARALNPIHERQVLGRSILLFDRGVNQNPDKNIHQKLDPQKLDRQQLAALGDVRTPGIADLFVAVMGDKAGNNASPLQGASR
jgi:ABC-2 type transport system ATP-binding protein